MRILVSACLLGLTCRYSGDGKAFPPLAELLNREDLSFVPVCPEQLGGLSTPRPPSERVGERVLTRDGADVTEQYVRGAAQAEELARLVTAARLKNAGIPVFDEEHWAEFLNFIKEEG